MGTIVANQGYVIPVGRFYLRTPVAVSRGEVMALDDTSVNSTTGLVDAVRVPAAGDVLDGVPAIAEKDIPANKSGWFTTDGTSIPTNVNGAIATAGASLGFSATNRYLVAVAANNKVVAKSKATKAAGTALLSCDVKGSDGFGHRAT